LRNFTSGLMTILTKPVCIGACALVTLVILDQFENQLRHLPFVALCLAIIALLLYAITARPAFSVYATSAFGLLICGISTLKYRMKGFDLHVYDLVYTTGDSEVLGFLAEEYGYLIAPVAALAVVGTFILARLFWFERKRQTKLAFVFFGFLAAVAGLPATYPLDSSEPRYFHYLGGYNASSFFISLMDVQYLAIESELAGRLARLPAQPPFSDEVSCQPREESPDVFVVLNESHTNPAYFPQLPGGLIADEFRSMDGRMRELQVETFGGGTWTTNFSVLTGLSSADFGPQSPFLTTHLEGRVAGAIPELMARCGYRTVAILPMRHSFVNEGPFLESIGFETVLDYEAIGANRYIHRDKFYFDAAEKIIAEHRRSDPRPLFLAMQTMFAHSPYSEELAGNATGPQNLVDDPELNEYLRRLVLSRTDLQTFLDARKESPTSRGTAILEFGDHQSFATKALVDEISGSDSMAELGSLAYRTHYALHAYGYEPRQVDAGGVRLDVGFVGASFLDWAHLPTSPLFQSLLELRDFCEGKFYNCDDRTVVDLHLKRRIDSGILQLP